MWDKFPVALDLPSSTKMMTLFKGTAALSALYSMQ